MAISNAIRDEVENPVNEQFALAQRLKNERAVIQRPAQQWACGVVNPSAGFEDRTDARASLENHRTASIH